MLCSQLSDSLPQADIGDLVSLAVPEVFPDPDRHLMYQHIQHPVIPAVDVYDADIINMSWTLNQDSEELHEAICYAAKQNVLLVAAAGNLSLSTPLGSQVYPASWEEVIGVSGADLNEQGEPVSSLWYLQSDAVFVSADGNYQGEKGSSFAAPRISGILAGYLDRTSEEKHTQSYAEEYLKSIAVDAGHPGYDTVFGWGYVKNTAG